MRNDVRKLHLLKEMWFIDHKCIQLASVYANANQHRD